jgi:hypothetical protein
MNMASFDAAVSQAAARAHLLEMLLHDRHRWSATLYGMKGGMAWRIPLTRTVLEEEHRVLLIGYAPEQCRGVDLAEISCGWYVQTITPVPEHDGPFRFIYDMCAEVIPA